MNRLKSNENKCRLKIKTVHKCYKKSINIKCFDYETVTGNIKGCSKNMKKLGDQNGYEERSHQLRFQPTKNMSMTYLEETGSVYFFFSKDILSWVNILNKTFFKKVVNCESLI